MRRFCKFHSTYIALLLVFLGVLSSSGQEPRASEPIPEAKEETGKINIAIPLNEPVKGIHLPFYTPSGKLKMQFDAEGANRTSNNLVEMKVLKIETFDETGGRDMLVSLPEATYDTSSSVIKTEKNVEVRRHDFVLTGVGMEFNTKKQSGRVFSQIRMEIFNRSTDLPTSTPNGP